MNVLYLKLTVVIRSKLQKSAKDTQVGLCILKKKEKRTHHRGANENDPRKKSEVKKQVFSSSDFFIFINVNGGFLPLVKIYLQLSVLREICLPTWPTNYPINLFVGYHSGALRRS